MKPPMLTFTQACERLSIRYTAMHALISKGRVRAAKIGGVWRIDPADLEAYIELQKGAAHPPTVIAAVAAAFDADDQFDQTDNPFL